MKAYLLNAVLICGLIMFVTGCSSHYRVTDPASGKVYYAKKIHEERGGAVKIKDERTGSTVTLQNSEVTKISTDEYDAALRQPPVVVQP